MTFSYQAEELTPMSHFKYCTKEFQGRKEPIQITCNWGLVQCHQRFKCSNLATNRTAVPNQRTLFTCPKRDDHLRAYYLVVKSARTVFVQRYQHIFRRTTGSLKMWFHEQQAQPCFAAQTPGSLESLQLSCRPRAQDVEP